MTRLLLDAQALVWWDLGSAELGKQATQAIRAAHAVYVSAVSEWELSIKAALGKVVLRRSILDATLEAGFEPLAITFHHAQAVRSLQPVHRDPFDRLLVAVALVEGLTVVTSDPILAEYPIRILDARR